MDTELFAIQKKLKELGHDPGPLDGIWGGKTRKAIAAHLGIKTPAKSPSQAATEAPWMTLARTYIGTTENPGAGNNATVQSFYEDAVGQKHPDSVPWCAGFVGAMLKRSGYAGTESLMARSYLNWGTTLAEPRAGCIVVFKRGAPPSGHVAFAVDWTKDTIRVLGGNQSDAVNIKSFKRSEVLGYRWPSEALA